MNRVTTTAVLLVALLFGGPRAHAFVQQMDTNEFGSIVSISWSTIRAQSGLRYFVNTRSFPFPETDVNRVVAASFGAWEAVETASIRFTNGGSGSRINSGDGDNVIVFDATGAEIGAPRGSGVIAITLVNWNNSGRITDTDIVFNGRDFTFVARETPPAIGQGLIDLQDVMTHEIGHMIGLDHTPLNGHPTERPTMNPFNPQDGPGEERTLEVDDIAGVTTIYPSAVANRFGSISGKVTRATGAGAFGVHVIAFRRDTGAFAVSALSGSAGNDRGRTGDGSYVISGLPPGEYAVGIQPVDGSNGVTDENIGGIFSNFDVGFPVEFYDNAPSLSASQTIVVGAGQVQTDVNFILGTAREGFPSITDTDLPVNTPDSRGPYPVRVRVTDVDGSVASVVLRYAINGGTPVHVPMHLSAGVWSAEIPGQPAGTIVLYRVAATDDDGNTSTLPPESQDPLRLEVLQFTDEPVIYVAMRNSGALAVIESGTGDEVARIATGIQPLSVLLSPDDRLAFVANNGISGSPGSVVTAVETATHRVVEEIRVGSGPLDMAVTEDGSQVFVSNSNESTFSVIDVTELRQVRKIRIPGLVNGPYGIAVNAAGTVVYVTDIDADVVVVVDAATGEVLARIAVVPQPRSLELVPGGKELLVSGFLGGVSVVNTRTNAVTATYATGAGTGAFRVASSPDGQRIYATDQANGRLLVIDRESGDMRSIATGGRNTRGLAVSRSGDRVYVTNQDSDEFVEFDTNTLQVVRRFTAGDGPRGIAIRYASFDTIVDPPDTNTVDVDITGDGVIDFGDFVAFARSFGTRTGDADFDPRIDYDGDGLISFADFVVFARNFTTS